MTPPRRGRDDLAVRAVEAARAHLDTAAYWAPDLADDLEELDADLRSVLARLRRPPEGTP